MPTSSRLSDRYFEEIKCAIERNLVVQRRTRVWGLTVSGYEGKGKKQIKAGWFYARLSVAICKDNASV